MRHSISPRSFRSLNTTRPRIHNTRILCVRKSDCAVCLRSVDPSFLEVKERIHHDNPIPNELGGKANIRPDNISVEDYRKRRRAFIVKVGYLIHTVKRKMENRLEEMLDRNRERASLRYRKRKRSVEYFDLLKKILKDLYRSSNPVILSALPSEKPVCLCSDGEEENVDEQFHSSEEQPIDDNTECQ